MMKFIVGLLLIFLVPSSYSQCSPPTLGLKSGVYCVSKTAFVFAADDDPIIDSLECPAGQVCADVLEICSATADPVCRNTIPGSDGTCSECRDETTAHKVCISETEYAICNKGTLLALEYACPTAKPNCKYVAGEDICTTSRADLDCSAATNETNGGDGGTGGNSTTTEKAPVDTACTAEGLFPDPTDKVCLRYYKCTKNSSGQFVIAYYECATVNYYFNPSTQRCELNYQCPP